MAVLDAVTGKSRPLTLAFLQCLKANTYWTQRATTWQQCYPLMRENSEPWAALAARAGNTFATIEHCSEWNQIADTYSKLHPRMLPGYGNNVKLKIVISGAAVLKLTEAWEPNGCEVPVSTVDQCCKFAQALMLVNPAEVTFAQHHRRLTKVLNSLGSKAIMQDVISRVDAAAKNVTGPQELENLSKSLELASSVDLRGHTDAIRFSVDMAMEHFYQGELCDIPLSTTKTLLECFITVAQNAGLTKHAKTIETQIAIYSLIHSQNEFKRLGSTYADIAAVADAESKFGQLHRANQLAKSMIADAQGTEIGIYMEKVNNDALISANTVLTEYSAVSVENKDRALTSMAEKLATKSALDPISFKCTWGKDVKSFAAFVEEATRMICSQESTTGLKALIAETREAIQTA